eukprot:sb/3461848/
MVFQFVSNFYRNTSIPRNILRVYNDSSGSFPVFSVRNIQPIKSGGMVSLPLTNPTSPPPGVYYTSQFPNPTSPPPGVSTSQFPNPTSPPPGVSTSQIPNPTSPLQVSIPLSFLTPLLPPTGVSTSHFLNSTSPPPGVSTSQIPNSTSPPPGVSTSQFPNPTSPPPGVSTSQFPNPTSPPPGVSTSQFPNPTSPPPGVSTSQFPNPTSPPPGVSTSQFPNPTSPPPGVSTSQFPNPTSPPPGVSTSQFPNPTSPPPGVSTSQFPNPTSPPPGVSTSQFPNPTSPPPGVSTSQIPNSTSPPPGVSTSQFPNPTSPPPGVSTSQIPNSTSPPPGVSTSQFPNPTSPPPGVSTSQFPNPTSPPPGVSTSQFPNPTSPPPGVSTSQFPNPTSPPPGVSTSQFPNPTSPPPGVSTSQFPNPTSPPPGVSTSQFPNPTSPHTVLHCTPAGKVLLTEADKLPTVEVEGLVTAPSAETELTWLFKHAVSGWQGTSQLREELAQCQDVGGIGLRYKILSGAIYLQECLSCTDLGVPYYRLVKREGQLLILLIKTVDMTSPPFTSVSLKPLSSLTTSAVQPRDAFDIAHLNAADLQTLYTRFSVSQTPGLFVGLLQFKMKGEDLEIVVDKSSPLLPPIEYVRENGHVTSDEWRSLTMGNDNSVLCRQVSAAACTLLSRVQDTLSDIDSYSIYTKTIVEMLTQKGLYLYHYRIMRSYYGEELTRSILHTIGHVSTCHALLTQQIRQTINSDRCAELKKNQSQIKSVYDTVNDVWAQYCTFSNVLADLMTENSDSLRSISDLLSPSSPATSVTDTLDRSSGVVRIYSSGDLVVPAPCIKLHITSSTKSRDVINSVARKLRRQELPVSEDVGDFRLVVTVSNVLRQIPDNVPVLQLGEPWVSARFQIRLAQTPSGGSDDV